LLSIQIQETTAHLVWPLELNGQSTTSTTSRALADSMEELRPGRPRMTWIKTIQRDLNDLDISVNDAELAAQD